MPSPKVPAPIPIGYSSTASLEFNQEFELKDYSISDFNHHQDADYIAITYDPDEKKIVFCILSQMNQLKAWQKENTGKKLYIIPRKDFDAVLQQNPLIRQIYQNELGDDFISSLRTPIAIGAGDAVWMLGCTIIGAIEANQAPLSDVAGAATSGAFGLVVPAFAALVFYFAHRNALVAKQGHALTKTQHEKLLNGALWLAFKMFCAILGWSAGAILAAATGANSIWAKGLIIGLCTGLTLAAGAYFADRQAGIDNPPSTYLVLFLKGFVNGFAWSVMYDLIPPLLSETLVVVGKPALEWVTTYIAIPLITSIITFVAVSTIFMMDKIALGLFKLTGLNNLFSEPKAHSHSKAPTQICILQKKASKATIPSAQAASSAKDLTAEPRSDVNMVAKIDLAANAVPPPPKSPMNVPRPSGANVVV